jgi:hypothetical protein
MLNKEICKKCCNTYCSEPWSENDELDWNEGLIKCPYPYIKKTVETPKRFDRKPKKLNQYVPINCSFKLEQLLETEMVKTMDLDICLKCWEKSGEKFNPVALENLFNEGKIYCPKQINDGKSDITGTPILKCPYRLEHILNAQ